jgi:hypothetical protein
MADKIIHSSTRNDEGSSFRFKPAADLSLLPFSPFFLPSHADNNPEYIQINNNEILDHQCPHTSNQTSHNP